MADDSTSSITNKRAGKRQYLVTYSQADETKFSTRESFGQAVKSAFEGGKVAVSHWACCREEHNNTEGFHYHCCLKLTGVKKWLSVKNKFQKAHNVVLNFSDKHDHYVSAYRYVCKQDREVFCSIGHPNLESVGSPRTKACINAYRKKRRSSTLPTSSRQNEDECGASGSGTAQGSCKSAKLSNIEVSDLIVSKKIRSKLELYAIAEQRKENGECDLARFLFSRTEKNLEELIEKSWLLKSASSELVRTNTSRMEVVLEAAQNDCETADCDWLNSAIEVLTLNNIEVHVFAGYLNDLLSNGRAKWRNIMIIGRSNCAKTFMLKPLQSLFQCFENPSNDKFAWVGAEKADVILMNDFRYSKEIISWKDLLLLLEGETVKLPAPKNHFINDIVIDTDVPIFCTSKSRIVYRGPFNSEDDRETEMMNSRWRVVEFTHVFKEHEQKDIKACKNCFAKLVMMTA